MENGTRKGIIALAILLFTSCGGGGSSPTPASSTQPDYSGTYYGTATLDSRSSAMWGQKNTAACSCTGPLTVTITGKQATLVLSKYVSGEFYEDGHTTGTCWESNDVFSWKGLLTANRISVDTGYGTFDVIINGSVLSGSGNLRWTYHLPGEASSVAAIDGQEFWYLSASKR